MLFSSFVGLKDVYGLHVVVHNRDDSLYVAADKNLGITCIFDAPAYREMCY